MKNSLVSPPDTYWRFPTITISALPPWNSAAHGTVNRLNGTRTLLNINALRKAQFNATHLECKGLYRSLIGSIGPKLRCYMRKTHLASKIMRVRNTPRG